MPRRWKHIRFMRTFFLITVLMTFASSLARAEIPLDDSTIVLGQRVGPIEKGMTLFGLKMLFGGGKVKAAELPGPEGTTIDGAKMFEGTDKEIEIIFNPEGDEKEIEDIRIIGKGWKFENGLKLGMSLIEVEKINGKPYTVLGFGWDYGGYANFEGGKLEGTVSIRFDVEPQAMADAISGDQSVPSTHKVLRAAKPKIETISVSLR